MKLRFLRTSAQDSINRRIFRAALTVGCVTALVKSGVVVKDLIVARSFGRNDSLDAFLFALILPAFAVTLVAGAVSAATVPVLVEVRQKEGEAAGQQLLATVTLLTTLTLIVAAVLLGAFAPSYLPYLAHSFPQEKLLLTREFLYMLLPWLVLSGLAGFIATVLNAVERFAIPALVPLLTPLAIIVFIIAVTRRGSGFALAGGTVTGSLLEAAMLFYLLSRHHVLGAVRWYGMNGHVRAVLAQAGPMMAGCLLMGATPVVDQAMAAMLAPGSVAALSYGGKVVTGLLAIGATALSTATLPYFSRMAAQSDWQGCRHTLKRYSVLVLAVTVPLTILLALFSRPLVRILFQRGAFTTIDTDVVSRVQVYYCIQIPFYTLCMLFVRFISSVRRNDLLMYASAINLVVDVVLNIILMRILGVAGIALSSSIVMAGSLFFLCLSSIQLLARRSPSGLATVPVSARQ
jgi:putative peptidoglycan lipid II flippase